MVRSRGLESTFLTFEFEGYSRSNFKTMSTKVQASCRLFEKYLFD